MVPDAPKNEVEEHGAGLPLGTSLQTCRKVRASNPKLFEVKTLAASAKVPLSFVTVKDAEFRNEEKPMPKLNWPPSEAKSIGPVRSVKIGGVNPKGALAVALETVTTGSVRLKNIPKLPMIRLEALLLLIEMSALLLFGPSVVILTVANGGGGKSSVGDPLACVMIVSSLVNTSAYAGSIKKKARSRALAAKAREQPETVLQKQNFENTGVLDISSPFCRCRFQF